MSFDSKHLNGFKTTHLDEYSFFRQFPELRLQKLENCNDFYLFDKNWGIEFDIKKTYSFDKKDIKDVFEFAYASKSFHRKYRSGGTNVRNELSIFLNIFLGKLGELATLYSFQKNNIEMENDSIDYTIREKGEWDDYDLKTKNGKILSVKSSKYYSLMMLLESKNWNSKSELIYNIDSNKSYIYDYHIYSRIGAKEYKNSFYCFKKAFEYSYYYDIIENYKKNNQNYNDDSIKNLLFNSINKFDWIYEDVFIINNDYFKKIIKLNHKIEAKKYVIFDENVLTKLSKKKNIEIDIYNYKLNCYTNIKSKFELDATNYYFPLKYMFNIKDYLNIFK